MRKVKLLLIVLSSLLILSSCNFKTDTPENILDAKDPNDISDIMNRNDETETENTNITTGDFVDLDDLRGDGTTENTENRVETNKPENVPNEDKISPGDLIDNLGVCEIRVIDCGQADSILIHSGEDVVLVDAGEKKDAKAIKEVLDSKDITEIDILVATHPHEDHIGGMQTILQSYEVKKLIMSPTGHTSKLYENLLLEIDSQGMMIDGAKPGQIYTQGDIKLEVIAPCDKYSELNDNSVVIIASYGETDILLTGDAEVNAEEDFIEYVRDVDILKVGHHGSDTSTSEELLNVAKPEYALISCGVDNKYGHPKQVTLEKLSKNNIYVLRTDLSGDLIVRTNGSTYSIETEKDGEISTKIPVDNNETTEVAGTRTVYVTKSGTKYHSRTSCMSIVSKRNLSEMLEQDALNKGYTRCSRCWEPT